MNKKLIEKVVRFGFSLIFLGNALNILFNVFPIPEMNIKAQLILGALERSGYIMIVAAIIQITASILYLLNRFVSIANLLILPTVLNIFLFSIFLEPMLLVITIPIVIALSYMIYIRLDHYSSLFKAH